VFQLPNPVGLTVSYDGLQDTVGNELMALSQTSCSSIYHLRGRGKKSMDGEWVEHGCNINFLQQP